MAKSLANGDEEELRRIEKDRLEINAAYDNGFSNDMNESDNISLNGYTSDTNNNNGTMKSRNSSKANDLSDRIDRYGFIHKSKLPPQLTEIELKRNNIEKLREIKWRSMLKEWPKHFSPSKQKYSDKLVSRIFKGIPNSMRNAAWYKLLDIETQIKAQSGVYEKMKNLARKYSQELRQIDLDINRTFRNNCAYKKRYCQRQRQLYNILAAYSIYNTEIGYCQGMSTLTALLLMYLSDEEQTFWALSQLMSNSKYSMHGFYKADFPKLLRYSDKHEMIIKTLLPKIHNKFIKCNITPLIYTTKWYLQCFLDALPFSLVLRVWDVYLLKGDIAILAMSYCILKMHKKTLLQKEFDMDKINEFLNHKLPEDFMYDDDQVMEKLQLCIDKLNRYKFDSGPLIDAIPTNELPKIPFGDFKKIDKQEMITQIVKNTRKSQSETHREAMLEQMAKDRLETEKKNREERRRKRREERKKLIENSDSKNISNVSDADDDDDDDDDDIVDNDSDDDDLNPSKLSEYDDDKVDKESMLSNLTRQSTPQRSYNDIQSQLSLDNKLNTTAAATVSLTKKSKHSKQSTSNNSLTNQMSDYENLTSSKGDIVKIKNDSVLISDSVMHGSLKESRSPGKPPIVPQPALITTTTTTTTTTTSSPPQSKMSSLSPKKNSIPNSQSYVTSIMSNPPPISPSTYLQSNSNSNVTSIRSNGSYFLTSSDMINQNSSSTTPKMINNNSNKAFEYVRSPHGIYTRVNVPPNNSFSINRSPSSFKTNSYLTSSSSQNYPIPQSTSTVLISNKPINLNEDVNYNIPINLNQSSRRTASLRSIQKPLYNQHNTQQPYDLVSIGSANNPNGFSRANTQTKQQLQNHSLRIASIQQQQQQQQQQYNNTNSNHLNGVYSNYPTMSIIAQIPKTTSPQQQQQFLNQQMGSLDIGYQPRQNLSDTNNQQNSNKINISHDLIEQYDYI